MRRLTAILLAGPLALAPVGCGDSPGTRTAPEVDADADLTELPESDATTPDVSAPDTAPADTRDTAERDTDAPSDTGPTLDTRDADTADTGDAGDATDTRPPVECPWLPFGDGLTGGRVSRIEFDPRTPGVAWAVSGGTLFRSVDGGVSWEDWASEVSANVLGFPEGEAKELLVGGNGLALSVDIGRSFEPLALSGIDITALLLDPAVPSRVWVGTNALGILRSDNDGQTFAARNNGVGLVRVLSMVGFPDAPDVLLAGTVGLNENLGANDKGTILRTIDGGRSWAQVHNDARWVWDLAVCPSDPSRVYAAVRKGIRHSRDYGATWDNVIGLAGLDVLEIEVQDDCDTFWASVYQRGIYRVSDGGATVQGPMSRGLDLQLAHLAAQLSAHPTEPGVLLLGSHAGAFRTDNGGVTWRRVAAARGLQVTRLAQSPTDPERVYLTSWGGGLWTRSTTSPWERVETLEADYLFGVNPVGQDSESLVIGGQSSNWVTDSGLDGFRRTTGPANIFDAELLPDGSWLVATQVVGLMRSRDHGLTWTPANGGLTPWPTSAGTFIDVAVIAVLDDRLVVGSRGRGILISEDDATSWRHTDNSLSLDSIVRLYPTDHGLVAMVEGKGLHRSLDGGETWAALDLGSGTVDLRDLAYDPVTGWLFASQSRGPLLVSRDGGERWSGLDSYCNDAQDFGALAVIGPPTRRVLVAAQTGNRVLAHPLPSELGDPP